MIVKTVSLYVASIPRKWRRHQDQISATLNAIYGESRPCREERLSLFYIVFMLTLLITLIPVEYIRIIQRINHHLLYTCVRFQPYLKSYSFYAFYDLLCEVASLEGVGLIGVMYLPHLALQA